MGRIRTKNIKKAAVQLKEAYPDRFSKKFEENKAAINELNLFENKRTRNKVAGYVTRLGVRKTA